MKSNHLIFKEIINKVLVEVRQYKRTKTSIIIIAKQTIMIIIKEMIDKKSIPKNNPNISKGMMNIKDKISKYAKKINIKENSTIQIKRKTINRKNNTK